MRSFRLLLYTIVFVAIAAVIITLTLTLAGPSLTEAEVRTVVVDTFLRERPETFVVTGTVEFTTSVISESDKTLLPGVINLDLGTTSATVRAPGRAAYGFDASLITAEDIRLQGDTVVVWLPPLEVFAVEPDLELLEQQIDVGWARMHRSSGQAQALAALRGLQPAMRELAEEFLVTADGPVENSIQAVERILSPALRAAGVENPVFRIEPRPLVIVGD
ncbi:MAG: DUF4230 domain-containing protein [Rhodothermales bacterium]|nr:DUF4230 domain-containing protein [Rhodothermales bacterium]MBO6780192.1 DUF4230 domain-containing protein [Rhodothermales bacterium]